MLGIPQALKNKRLKVKANGQASNSAKAVKSTSPFEQTNLSDGTSNHYWVQNLDALSFMYLCRSWSHLQNIQVKTLAVPSFSIELEPKALTKLGSYRIREQLNLLFGFFFFFPVTIYLDLIWKMRSLLPAQLKTS